MDTLNSTRRRNFQYFIQIQRIWFVGLNEYIFIVPYLLVLKFGLTYFSYVIVAWSRESPPIYNSKKIRNVDYEDLVTLSTPKRLNEVVFNYDW